MSIPIRFIYFDLGNVLFDVEHTSAWHDTLNATNLPKEVARQRFYNWGAPIDHMTGKISDALFFEEMKQLLEYIGSPVTLKSIWKSVFIPNTVRLQQAQRLTERISGGFLSNISPCHSEHIENRVAAVSHFWPRIYSWQCGFMKPRHEIFELAIASCKFRPEEILFIDDQEQHCEAARSLGMHALQLSPEQPLCQSVEAAGYRI